MSDSQRAQARLAELETMQAQRATPPPIAPTVSFPPPTAADEPDYLKMSAADRQQFCEDCGTISKQTFDALTPVAKMKFCKDGGKVEPTIRKNFNTGNHS